MKEKWGEAIRPELVGLFDSNTFSFIDKTLLANEIFPTKLAFKIKLNRYRGLDQQKAKNKYAW